MEHRNGVQAKPDAALDGLVGPLATRITFDKDAIRETKRLVGVSSLPPDVEIAPEGDALLASLKRPAAQERIRKPNPLKVPVALAVR